MKITTAAFVRPLQTISASAPSYAPLNAATGQILWSFKTGGSVMDGPSIVDGVLYWGSGFPNGGSTNNKVYAFSLPQ